jgi:hypothetical protein
MVTISSSTKSNDKPRNRVIMIGFCSELIKSILDDKSIAKLVIFDYYDKSREEFEKIYPLYKDRITLYEGEIRANLGAYLKLREQEGITKDMHRLEVGNLEMFKSLERFCIN